MRLIINLIPCLVFLFYLSFGTLSFAQSRFTGQVSNYNSWGFFEPHELISGRNNVRLNFSNSFDRGRVYLSSNLRQHYAFSTDSLDFRLREAFFDVFFDNGDLRVGKQVIVWGKADGDFIMDAISPFDLSEFITQEFTELREGVTAISYTHYFGRTQLQAIINPLFEPSRLPEYSGRWAVVPADFLPIPTDFISYQNTTPTLSDTQVALRLALRPSLNLDLDFGILYWNSRTPGYFKTFETTEVLELRVPERVQFEETYRAGLIAGGWGEYRILDKFRFVFEAAYYQNRPYDVFSLDISHDDIALLERLQQGDIDPNELGLLLDVLNRFNTALDKHEESGFLTYRPSVKFMGGIATDVFNWSLGIQYTGDAILDYEDDILQDAYFHSITTTINRSFLRDTLLFRFLGRYQINGNDFWLNPEFRYDFTDGLTFGLGAHIFGGSKPEFDYAHLSFQSFNKNSLLFISGSWAW